MDIKKKVVVGLLYTGKKIGKEEELFLKFAKKKKIDLVLINLSKKFSEYEFEKNVRKCSIVYCSSAEDYVLEPLKTVEALGIDVIDPSWIYYYVEDKWLFYIKCKKHKIPTPDTILLSSNLNFAKAELKDFGRWPIVIKRIYGTCGEYVEKADTLEEAMNIIKRFQNNSKIPIIAQEFVKSFSYRVTIIGNDVVQTIVKKSKKWKCTGVYSKINPVFEIDGEMKKILGNVRKFVNISICGIDFFKKDGKWLISEVNTQPAFDFKEEEHEKIINKSLDFFLEHYRKKHPKKSPLKKHFKFLKK